MSEQVMNQFRSDRQLREDCVAIYEALGMDDLRSPGDGSEYRLSDVYGAYSYGPGIALSRCFAGK